MNNGDLAQRFGQTLGIGKPNQNVSQSTIHKYRKINSIRLSGSSKEIINDIINERLQFTIAAELLAPIQDPEDRNRFYLDVIKTLSATRSQAIQIKKLLEEDGKQLKTTLQKKEIREAIEKALLAENKCSAFIKYLQKKHSVTNTTKDQFQKRVATLRDKLFKNAQKNDFKITQPTKGKKKEITLQVKIRPDTIDSTMAGFKRLAEDPNELSQLFTEEKE
jgi:ParB family chromosome partitioning protein